MLEKAIENDLYAEVVSNDEYELAKRSGYELGKIIFNGPQKSIKYLIESINANQITNLDSMQEVDMLIKHRKKLAPNPTVGLRINFDLEKYCPNETTAGKLITRFGISVENGDFCKAVDLLHEYGIKINSIHLHYSTKTRSVNVFKNLAKIAIETIYKYKLQNEIEFIDIGGGFFYGENIYAVGKPKLSDYADVIISELKALNKRVTLVIEPGASLISTTVKYYTKIMSIKNVFGKRFCVVDGSVLHINPLMQVRKNIVNIIQQNKTKIINEKQCICGCTCMEMDRFIEFEDVNELAIGDYIECDCAGAYTMVYNSNFINTPPYIYAIYNNKVYIIRKKNKNNMNHY